MVTCKEGGEGGDYGACAQREVSVEITAHAHRVGGNCISVYIENNIEIMIEVIVSVFMRII